MMERNNRGTALVLVIAYLFIFTAFAAAFLAYYRQTHEVLYRAKRQQVSMRAAESGIQKAVAELRKAPEAYQGEEGTPIGDAVFTTVVEATGTRTYHITVTAQLSGEYGKPHPRTLYAVLELDGGAVGKLVWAKERLW